MRLTVRQLKQLIREATSDILMMDSDPIREYALYLVDNAEYTRADVTRTLEDIAKIILNALKNKKTVNIGNHDITTFSPNSEVPEEKRDAIIVRLNKLRQQFIEWVKTNFDKQKDFVKNLEDILGLIRETLKSLNLEKPKKFPKRKNESFSARAQEMTKLGLNETRNKRRRRRAKRLAEEEIEIPLDQTKCSISYTRS